MGWKQHIRSWWPPRNYYLKPPYLNWFFQRVVFDFALANPELLSFARVLERFGIHWHNKRLTDISARARIEQNRRFGIDLRILRSYNPDSLSPSDKVSYQVLEWYLDNEAARKPFLFHDYPVNQLSGVHKELPQFMTTIHQIQDGRDAGNYIHRLRRFPTKIRQVIKRMQYAEQKGVIPPRFVVERVVAELDTFIQTAYHQNELYTTFENRVKGLQGLSASRIRHFNKLALTAMEERVYPAFLTLRQYIDELRKKASEEDGVWKLPDGDRYYRYVLRSHLTTDKDPAWVHQMGLEEVARIEEEMRTAMNAAGCPPVKEKLGDCLLALAEDPAYLFDNTPEGREACMAHYKSLVQYAEKRMSSLFHTVPDKPVLVERLPHYKEPTSPEAYYEPPSLGGKRPGLFYVNLRDLTAIPKWAMATLAFHETIPGHHLQVSLQMAQRDVPFFRNIIPFTAYVEGWALYAERLAWEQGWLTDPMDNIGRLQSELLRAVRLVADTGLHWKRWSRQQTIDFMTTHTGIPRSQIVTEVERYIVHPGQACAYKVGELHLLQLRQRMQEALGDAFQLADFHHLILSAGAVPLPVLDTLADNYLQQYGQRQSNHHVA